MEEGIRDRPKCNVSPCLVVETKLKRHRPLRCVWLLSSTPWLLTCRRTRAQGGSFTSSSSEPTEVEFELSAERGSSPPDHSHLASFQNLASAPLSKTLRVRDSSLQPLVGNPFENFAGASLGSPTFEGKLYNLVTSRPSRPAQAPSARPPSPSSRRRSRSQSRAGLRRAAAAV